jgi:hypothetical protein
MNQEKQAENIPASRHPSPSVRITSKTIIICLAVLLGIIVLAGVFELGTMVGFRKARFASGWKEQYSNNFGPPMMRGPGFPSEFPGRMDPHGAFGSVISTSTDQLVVKSREGAERIVTIKPDTEIRRGKDRVSLGSIGLNANLVVFGRPNELGQIEARLIRVLDQDFQP